MAIPERTELNPPPKRGEEPWFLPVHAQRVDQALTGQCRGRRSQQRGDFPVIEHAVNAVVFSAKSRRTTTRAPPPLSKHNGAPIFARARAAMSETPALGRGLQLVVLVLAALFEVGGDALIRAGLRGKGFVLIAIGFVILGSYGLVLNQLSTNFSKLLGVYVGLFAVVSVLFGKFLFQESIPLSTWLGLGVVLVGSLIIQWG